MGGGGGEGGGERGYAGKVADIKRMTKNQNQRLFILPMCVGVGGGGGQGRAGPGRANGAVCRGVEAIIFICDTMF